MAATQMESAVETCLAERWLSPDACFVCELPVGHEGCHEGHLRGEAEGVIHVWPDAASARRVG